MKERILDRRGLERRHLLYYLDVHDEESGTRLGQLGDITTDGLLIISDLPLKGLKEDEVRLLRIKSLNVEGFFSEDLVIKGKCCWAGLDFNPDLHCTGFQFIESDDELKKLVTRLIRLLGFRE